MFLYLVSPWSKSVEQGASSTLWAALNSELVGGEYLSDCQVSADVHPEASNVKRAADLWEYTERVLLLLISNANR